MRYILEITADSDVAELWTETESDSKSDTESVFLLISSLLSEVSTLDSVSAGTALGLITSEILGEASEVSETNWPTVSDLTARISDKLPARLSGKDKDKKSEDKSCSGVKP